MRHQALVFSSDMEQRPRLPTCQCSTAHRSVPAQRTLVLPISVAVPASEHTAQLKLSYKVQEVPTFTGLPCPEASAGEGPAGATGGCHHLHLSLLLSLGTARKAYRDPANTEKGHGGHRRGMSLLPRFCFTEYTAREGHNRPLPAMLVSVLTGPGLPRQRAPETEPQRSGCF